MGTTALGITYPSLTDEPRGPEQMQALAEGVDTLITADRTKRDPSWSTYTPSISGSTSGTWTAGASTIFGRYLRLGRMVWVWGSITLGAGVSVTGGTSGSLVFTLPVTAVSGYSGVIGQAQAWDVSVPTRMPCAARMSSTTEFVMYQSAGTGLGATVQNNLFNNAVITWVTGDIFEWNLNYVAAAAA